MVRKRSFNIEVKNQTLNVTVKILHPSLKRYLHASNSVSVWVKICTNNVIERLNCDMCGSIFLLMKLKLMLLLYYRLRISPAWIMLFRR